MLSHTQLTIQLNDSMNFGKHQQQHEEDIYAVPDYTSQLEGPFDPCIYSQLPPKMRELFDLISNRYEKDILLLGMLTVLSGCMPNVIANYDRNWIHPNLFAFIEAPAGAGKGVLRWARLVGSPIHQYLREETNLAREKYEQAKKDKAKQKDTDLSNLTEPSFKLLFIPANNSASSIVQTLNENEGKGILFSSEADTLANSLSQDWGNFSDVLRCAFHHEEIDLQRRLNREYLFINKPQLSVLLTGTKGQLLRLIPNAENGLFSRFMYYSFPADPKFRNVFDKNFNDPGKSFLAFGEIILEMYLYLKALETPIQFYLREEDELYFVRQFSSMNDITYSQTGTTILGTVHRLGLITMRISMILSTIRYFGNYDRRQERKICIHPKDFNTSSHLSISLLYHATMLLSDMKDGSKQIANQTKVNKLYERLPSYFSRTEAKTIADALNISESSLTRYLNGELFNRVGQGKYSKILNNTSAEHMSN